MDCCLNTSVARPGTTRAFTLSAELERQEKLCFYFKIGMLLYYFLCFGNFFLIESCLQNKGAYIHIYTFEIIKHVSQFTVPPHLPPE